MRFGFFASILFHLSLVGALVIWGARLAGEALEPEPSIPVELITEAQLAERTNVPTMRRDSEPDQQPEQTPPDDPVPVTPEAVVVEPEPEPERAAPPPPDQTPEPEPEPEPEPVVPDPAPDPEPEPPKPKPEPPKPKAEPKTDGFDLDALERKADDARRQQDVRDPRQVDNAQTGPIDVDGTGAGELTASAMAKLKAHVSQCWNPPDGAPNAENLIVTVAFDLNRDGTLKGEPKVENSIQIATSGNRFWQVAQREAVSAVIECQPYDFLPVDQYETWKAFSLVFRPPA